MRDIATLNDADPTPLFKPETWCYDSQMINWLSCNAVDRHPERVSGAWVFRGTRVPVAALFENLEEGASPAQFLEWFEGVSADQVREVLSFVAHESVVAPA